MVTKLITPELVTAYWFCPRKAFLLLRGDDGEPVHEYISVISQRAERNRQARLATINPSCPRVDRGERTDVIAGAIVKVSNFEARFDALVRENHDGSGARKRVEPYLAVGTGVTTRDQRIRMAAAGQVIAKGLRCPVPTGVILNTAGKRARVKLAALSSTIDPIIKILERWTDSLPSELPPIIINMSLSGLPLQTDLQTPGRKRRQSKSARSHDAQNHEPIATEGYFHRQPIVLPLQTEEKSKQADAPAIGIALI